MAAADTAVAGLSPEESLLHRMLTAQKRQSRHIVAEIMNMRGLMPLLMKSRNGSPWSTSEKAELVGHLRRLSQLSPYLLLLLLPGSALALPLYAWWLDRRRRPRR